MSMQYDLRQPTPQQSQHTNNPQQVAQQAVNTAMQRYQQTVQFATWQVLQDQAQHNPVAHSILDALRAGVEVPGLEKIFPGRRKTAKALRRSALSAIGLTNGSN